MNDKVILAEVMKIADEIRKEFNTKDIILFSSYAYGEPTKESDIDLCIVMNKTTERKREILKQIRTRIINIATKPIDLLVYNKDEFEERATLNSTFEYKIKNEGLKVGC